MTNMHKTMKRLFQRAIASRLILSILSIALIPFAGAQQGDIEEVVVEAEDSANGVLDDMVSVSAIDGEKLADAGIENVADVAQYVPNLTLSETETGTQICIRGICPGVNQGFDQSVGLFSDGVPLPRSNMARAPFVDLADVQVKRGPQYVLDGNYAIAGAVHMISNLNTDEFKSGFDFNFIPSQGDRKFLYTLSGPISERFSGNLAIQRQVTDGYIENTFKGQDEAQKDDWLARLVLGYQASENLAFKFKVEYGQFDRVGRNIEIILDNPTPNAAVEGRVAFDESNPIAVRNAIAQRPAAPWVTQTDRIYTPLGIDYDIGVNTLSDFFSDSGEYAFAGRTYSEALARVYELNDFPVPTGLSDTELNFERATDSDEFSENEIINFTLGTEWSTELGQVTAASSFISYEFEEAIDIDFTPVPFLENQQFEEYEQIFQSIDFKTNDDSRVQFQAGVWYLKSDLKFGDDISILLTDRGDDPSNLNPVNFEFFEDPIARSKPDPARGYLGYIRNGGLFGVGASQLRPTRRFDQDSELFAGYAQFKFNWSDQFRTVLGARYTYSEKKAVRDSAFVYRESGELPTSADIADNSQLQIIARSEEFLGLFLGIQAHTCRYEQAVLESRETFDECIRGTRTEEAFYPSLTFEYDVTNDLILRASARQAGKLGGFDARSVSRPDVAAGRGIPFGTFEFEDEKATTFELGTTWFLPEGLGRLNATAFYTDFRDLQVSRFDGKTGFVVDNAGEANTVGVEVDGYLQLSDTFDIQYSLAWIDFTFEDFPLGSCHLGRQPDFFQVSGRVSELPDAILLDGSPATAGVLPIQYDAFTRLPDGFVVANNPSNNVDSTISPPTFATLNIGDANPYANPYPNRRGVDAWLNGSILALPATCDFEGQTNQFVADWQGTVTFNYTREIPGLGNFKPTLDVIYNSGYHTSASQDPLVEQDEYFLFNGRLELSSFEEVWVLALVGENLSDEKIVSYSNDTPIGSRSQGARGFIGFVRPPRSIGINLRYNFY